MRALAKSRKAEPPAKKAPEWDLRLYVAGATPKSVEAFRNLQQLCEEHLSGRYHIEVVDLMKYPALAQADQILAVPTLVRKRPVPIRKLIGTLSNKERVSDALDFARGDVRPSGVKNGGKHG